MHGSSQCLPLRYFFRELSRATEVSQLYIAVHVEQNIVTFDVSVNNMAFVQELKAFESLVEDVFNHFFRVKQVEAVKDAGHVLLHHLQNDVRRVFVIEGLHTVDYIGGFIHLQNTNLRL